MQKIKFISKCPVLSRIIFRYLFYKKENLIIFNLWYLCILQALGFRYFIKRYKNNFFLNINNNFKKAIMKDKLTHWYTLLNSH